jgi:hypothetical protein
MYRLGSILGRTRMETMNLYPVMNERNTGSKGKVLHIRPGEAVLHLLQTKYGDHYPHPPHHLYSRNRGKRNSNMRGLRRNKSKCHQRHRRILISYRHYTLSLTTTPKRWVNFRDSWLSNYRGRFRNSTNSLEISLELWGN